MSVYSGFATREQETFYFKLLDKAVQLMGTRIIAFYRNDHLYDDRDWVRKMRKIFKFMNQMDQSKHLQPRFSGSLAILIQCLREFFGASNSSASKSPPSLIGGNNTSSSLQIIEEETQSEQVLQSLQHATSRNQDRGQGKIDQDASATFFPKFKQAHQVANFDKTQVLNSKRKDFSPIRVVDNHSVSNIIQEESFSKKLIKKISETRLAQVQGDTNQDMAAYIHNGIKQRSSFMGIMSRDLNKKASGSEGKFGQGQKSSRNYDSGPHPSVRTTNRAVNPISILDLMSGVTTASEEGHAPHNYTMTIGGLRNDRRYTLTSNAKMSQARYPEKDSQKLSPSNQGIKTQSSIFSRRDDSCGSLQSYQTHNNIDDYKVPQAAPPLIKRQLRQVEGSNMKQPHQEYSHSAAKLPQAVGMGHFNSDANEIEQPRHQQRGKASTSRLEELASQPVIQLHTKHYHYNTNNIKIQMLPNGKMDYSKISAEGESFRDDRQHPKLDHISKTLDRKKRTVQNPSDYRGRDMPGLYGNDFKIQATAQPRRVLILNSQNEASSGGQQSKIDTPKNPRKYFQLY